MTDKVLKIREKVVEIVNSINPFIPDEDGKNSDYEAGKLDAATHILQIIDSLEEPVSEKKCMFTKDSYTDEDRKVLCEDCKEKCEYSKKEEPISDDLEEASKEWLKPQLDKSYANYGEVKMMELTHFDGYAMLDAIEFGAKWQKAKDEYITEDLGEYIRELSKQFPEVSFAKLSRIAVRVAKWQKEQLMANATEVTVHIDAGGYPYIPQIEPYDYDKDIHLAKEGDKYKVILIKED